MLETVNLRTTDRAWGRYPKLDGFTAPEGGILVCLTVIFAEKLALNI